MNKIAVNPLLSLGFALGASAIAVLPGMAQTAPPPPTRPTSDALLDMLGGDATAPGGVVSIITGGKTVLPGFNFSDPNPFSASLTVTTQANRGRNTVVFSSLTEADWNTDVGGGRTLTQKWLSDVFTANGFSPSPTEFTVLLNAFIANKGRQYVSDPKIAYISPSGQTNLKVGLAGFLNASDLLKAAVGPNLAPLVPASVQASELVKVVVNGGTPQYLYGFNATNSEQSLLGPDFNPICTGGKANDETDLKATCPFTANYELAIGGLRRGTNTTVSAGLNWVNRESFPSNEPLYELACTNGTNTVSSTFGLCRTPRYNNATNTSPILASALMWFDPHVATGYDYAVTDAPSAQETASVPEPSNLFGLGLLGFGALLQRQLNKKKQTKEDTQDK